MHVYPTICRSFFSYLFFIDFICNNLLQSCNVWGGKGMKKALILLIALMVISIGLLSGCIRGTEDCSRCGGSGLCSTCDGNGYIILTGG